MWIFSEYYGKISILQLDFFKRRKATMKKKCLSLLLAGAMVLSMASVGMTASAEEDTIRVGMVTDVGGVNDGSFNQSSWEGLQRAMDELGIEADYLESATDADYATNIETFIDEEYDLIICVGYMLADATRAAAEDYPEQKFAIIDDSTCSDLDNVTCLMFEQAQASYLVGYVAGLTTESNTVGFVLGMSTDTMNQFGYGYLAGVLDANPEEHQKYMNEVHEKFIISIMTEPDSVPEADTNLWYRITHSRPVRLGWSIRRSCGSRNSMKSFLFRSVANICILPAVINLLIE